MADGEAPEIDSLFRCEVCGRPYVPKNKSHVRACEREECQRERRRGDDRARNSRWLESNRVYHSAVCAMRGRKLLVPAVKERLDTLKGRTEPIDLRALLGDLVLFEHGRAVGLREEPRDAWCIASPTKETLPGVALWIETGDGFPTRWDPSALRPMHAAVTKTLGIPHDRTMPVFTLAQLPDRALPVRLWLRYRAHAELLPSRSHMLLGDRRIELRFSRPWDMSAPAPVAPGQYRVRVLTRTPLQIHHSTGRHGREPQLEPTDLVKQLALLGDRIGVSRSPLVATVIARDTEQVDMRIGGHWAGWSHPGEVIAFVGSLDVECNAPALWLLRVAELVGMGGKTSLGFGRVRLADL